MPEVGITLSAVDFGAHHPVGQILFGGDRLGTHTVPEAGPTRARIELGLRAEQRRTTADAVVHPRGLVVPVSPGERPLGAAAAGHLELLRRQGLLPLLGAAFDRIGRGHGRRNQSGAQPRKR